MNDSVLATYLKEINKIPLLTHDEETELAVRASKGDVKAKEKIINAKCAALCLWKGGRKREKPYICFVSKKRLFTKMYDYEKK